MNIQSVSNPIKQQSDYSSKSKISPKKEDLKSSVMGALVFASLQASSSDSGEQEPKTSSLEKISFPTELDVSSILQHATSIITTPKKDKERPTAHSPISPSDLLFLSSEQSDSYRSPLKIKRHKRRVLGKLDFTSEKGGDSPTFIFSKRRKGKENAYQDQTSSDLLPFDPLFAPESFTSPSKKQQSSIDFSSPSKDFSSPLGKTLTKTSAKSPMTFTTTQSFSSTPKRKRKLKKEPTMLFSKALPSAIDETFSKTLVKKWFDPQKVYLLDGAAHNLIKQAGSKSCGAAALLMLYTDIARKGQVSFSLGKEFWEWYSFCHLTDREQLIFATTHTNLAESHLKLDNEKLSKSSEENVIILEEHLKESSLPVISSITHPIIEGHWIVVDAIKDQDVYIRDPYTGLAYKISRETLKNYISSGIEFVLYIKKIEQEIFPK